MTIKSLPLPLIKRHIVNNVRLVNDLLDYTELIHENNFILFLDFYKAFDLLECKFIFKSLKTFGFGDVLQSNQNLFQ